MERATKEIFRSWNWPAEPFTGFSNIPTPYKISKFRNLNPGAVYKSWNQLFSRGDVRHVYLLPDDWMVKRRSVILPGVNKQDLKSILTLLEEKSFLEMVHAGHVYHARGSREILKNGGELIFLELVNSSDKLVTEQTGEIVSALDHNINPIFLPERPDPSPEPKEKLLSVARKIAYSDIYKINPSDLAPKFRISPRTLIKRIDQLLDMKAFLSFPHINQSVMAGTNVMVVNGQFRQGMTRQTVLGEVFTKQPISENYLLYRVLNDSLNMLLSYDSAGELDACVSALDEVFEDLMVITRFETYINPGIFKS